MFEEMVFYHYILVYALLGLILIGATIPFWSSDYTKTIKRLRVYMFWFHGLITTVAFSGLVAFIFGKIDLNLSMYAMIVIYIILSFLQSVKYIKTINNRYPLKKIKIITLRYMLVDILLVVTLIVWKIKEHSSAVSIS